MNAPELKEASWCLSYAGSKESGLRIVCIRYGRRGHYETTIGASIDLSELSEEAIGILVDDLNALRGISPELRASYEIGSMFGWNQPGAALAVAHERGC